jgi:hypothetical protein
MADELELAALAAAGGLASSPASRDAHSAGGACPNCGETLHGAYCARCGQKSDDQHRSILHLAWEAIEGLTHLDGRIARTLPALAFNPGLLVKDHIEGRRARHVPPFRLFLVSLLAFMFVMEGVIGKVHTDNKSAQAPEAAAALNVNADVDLDDDVKAAKVNAIAAADTAPTSKPRHLAWLKPGIEKAVANPEFYKTVVFTWAHRLAILLLPITAFWLTLLYVYKREFYIYDHLITAMVFLSFVFLVYAVAFLVPGAPKGWAVLIATLWIPINLFMILRRGYGSSIIGALLKTWFLWAATSVVFASLIIGLLAWSLTQI